MLDGAAFNFIRSKFKADIDDILLSTAETVIPVQYDNAPSINNKNSVLWVSFKIRPGQSEQVSFGKQNRHRNLGLAIAGVFARIEKGDKEIMAIADSIKTAFTSVKENGVTYRTPSIDYIGHTNNLGTSEPNIWYQVNIICPYYFDHIA